MKYLIIALMAAMTVSCQERTITKRYETTCFNTQFMKLGLVKTTTSKPIMKRNNGTAILVFQDSSFVHGVELNGFYIVPAGTVCEIEEVELLYLLNRKK